MRYFLLTLFCLGLAACGFTPVYNASTGVNGVNVSDAFTYIKIDPMPNREGNILTNELVDRIYTQGEPISPQFRLVSTLAEKRTFKAGIAKDASTTREQLRMTVNVKLVSTETDAVLLDRNFTSYTNYNILASEYATVVAEEDAMVRGLTQITDDIMTQLSLYFRESKVSQ